jgi:hypothetical protein
MANVGLIAPACPRNESCYDGKTRKQPKLRVVKEEKMSSEEEAEEGGRQRLGSGNAAGS